jgi:hypothetical protein
MSAERLGCRLPQGSVEIARARDHEALWLVSVDRNYAKLIVLCAVQRGPKEVGGGWPDTARDRSHRARRSSFLPPTAQDLPEGHSSRLLTNFRTFPKVVALKIAVAVGVDAESLLKNQHPLLDWNAIPVAPETKPGLRELDINANDRLQFLVKAAFNAARKHPKGDRSALFVLLFDYWLADGVGRRVGILGRTMRARRSVQTRRKAPKSKG